MFFRRHSFIIKNIALFFLFALILTVIINAIWYRVTTRDRYSQSIAESENLLNQVGISVDNYFYAISMYVTSFIVNSEAGEILRSEAPSVSDEDLALVRERIDAAAGESLLISSVSVLMDRYEYSSAGDDMDLELLREKAGCGDFRRYGKSYDLSRVYYNNEVQDKNEATIAYMYRIKGESLRATVGVLVLELRYSDIRKIFDGASEGSGNQWLVYDRDALVYAPDGFQDELTDEQRKIRELAKAYRSPSPCTFQGRDCIAICAYDVRSDWTIVELIDRDTLFRTAKEAVQTTVGVVVLVIFLLTAAVVALLYRMLRPLVRITEAMQKVEHDQFDTVFDHTRDDEFGQIENGFNKMVGHINELLYNIRKQEEEKRKITIQTLRAQINPHFLYNTLNIIRWRAVLAGNETVANMIVALVKTVEFNGKRKEEFVTVRDEVDNVKNYVRLLGYHYEDKFQVLYELDEDAMGFYTPKLLLQPLVENAMFHGIVPKDGQGQIFLSVCREGEKICFLVSDDGVGVDLDGEGRLSDGIGFSNVNDRIRYYFGEEHTLRVTSSPGAGTAVRFSIPVIRTLPYHRAVMEEVK